MNKQEYLKIFEMNTKIFVCIICPSVYPHSNALCVMNVEKINSSNISK